MTTRRYGWVPDLPDQRDHLYAAAPVHLRRLPHSTDLTHLCPLVYDQGQLSSCTGNAIAAAVEFDRKRQGLPDVRPSRLFIYYNERVMEGTVRSDCGAQIRNGIKSVARQGVCPEREWPYTSPFQRKPPVKAYRAAVQDRAVAYQRLPRDLIQMKGCLASGLPFVLGITVYDSFEGPTVARTGHATMPASKEGVVGGHAVLAVGYDDRRQWFLVRNSWGRGWGRGGYFTLPYAYVTQPGLARDFWMIQLVTSDSA